jgi:hypothetical protein
LNKYGKKNVSCMGHANKDKILGLDNVRKTIAKLSLIVITLACLSTYYLFDRILSYFTHKSHGICSMYFQTRCTRRNYVFIAVAKLLRNICKRNPLTFVFGEFIA